MKITNTLALELPMRLVAMLMCLLQCMNTFASNTQPATANHAMVVSEQAIASQVGLDILRAGGNAIDAAVAVGYALAVVNPCCGNIGGGGFMTIHFANGKNTFLNFREKAPLKATKKMFLDAQDNLIKGATTRGYLAVAVPGTVMGLDTALMKYGTMTRKQVMAPAISLANNGYIVTPFDAKWFGIYAPAFRQEPNVSAIFLKKGMPYHGGERLIQRDLAHSLELIAEQGANAFYKGSITRHIVQSSEANGGILTMKDFSQYTMEELTPLSCEYRGYKILSAPPPSSGGTTLCEMLNIIENFPIKKTGFQSAESVREIVEAMRYGFADRNVKLGDPDFIHNPVDALLSKKYAATLSQKIKSANAVVPTSTMHDMHEQTDTTHYSIVDSQGNAVAVTYTINGFFGAKIIADHTGFFLNDEMDDFAAKPGSANNFDLVQYDPNAIAPGKRPLSSMTPTIVMKDGRVVMVIGSPGGPRIITTVLLTLLNVIDYGMTIKQAADAPRFHYQGFPDTIEVEPSAISRKVRAQLNRMGYHITPQETWAAVEAIYIDDIGKLTGANDYRRPDGAAFGY